MITPEQRKAAARIALRLAKAREDLTTFIEVVVRDQDGNRLDLAEFHRQWIAHVSYCWSHNLHCMLLAPFRHGKTAGFAVPLLTWKLGHNVNARAKIITVDDDSAKKRVNLAATIMLSPSYRAVFPAVRPGRKWTDHELFLRRPGMAVDPSLHARGVVTKGIGGGADFILFDDVVDQLNSSSNDQRKHVEEVVEMTWLSRLSPTARVLYVGTPWHLDDVTHHLMQRSGWCALIQRVSPTNGYWHEMEVVGAGADYPWVQGASQSGRAA